MSLPKEIQQLLENSYGELLSFHFSSGGCINSGGVARFKRETIFVKWNSIEKYPGMFKAEAKGLDLLRQADLKVPEVYFIDNTTSLSFLVLEYIGSEARGSAYWQELGHGLAQLHKIHNDSYGLDHDNYMGSLKQYNEPSFHWLDFFIRYRIDPQVKLASENGYISTSELRRIHSFKKNIANILTEEKPSLVHGDLWSGNIMIDSNGQPTIIDPAVSYSHREVDLAMTKLFGGFQPTFYEAYNEELPLDKGLDDRLLIYQLYPLLIHLNLFGSGYYRQCMSIIKRFS